MTLKYNLGDGEKSLMLSNARANNGRWHTIRMERYGTEFHLKLDGGEGRNYAYRFVIFKTKLSLTHSDVKKKRPTIYTMLNISYLLQEVADSGLVSSPCREI